MPYAPTFSAESMRWTDPAPIPTSAAIFAIERPVAASLRTSSAFACAVGFLPL